MFGVLFSRNTHFDEHKRLTQLKLPEVRFGFLNLVYNFLEKRRFQNIFPLAKVSFAKGKMLGAGRHPTGPEWGE